MIRSILTVCIGNICRSPMAAGLLRALARVPGALGGTGRALEHAGGPASRQLLLERGIDIEAHRAIQLSASHCSGVDIILVMDADQKRVTQETYRATRGKVFRLGEFQDRDIFDPYGGNRADFEQCLALIEAGVDEWAQRIALTA